MPRRAAPINRQDGKTQQRNAACGKKMKKPVEIPIGRTTSEINMTQFAPIARDLLLYDIPARYKEDEVY